MRLILAKLGDNKTIGYAFDELARILKRMDPTLLIDGRCYETADAALDGILWLGLDGSVTPSADDEIKIDVKNGAGVITGSNERAVLIAAYRFLYELGCRWLRPGEDGEVIPEKKLDADALNVCVTEKASRRHRAVCIEGAVSYEHVYNVINWLPKVGMNGYYVQFRVPYCFFGRWHHHENNPDYPDEPLTIEDVRHIWKRLEEEIRLRGLMYHATGHGWTCEPFGIRGAGWTSDTSVIPDEVKACFAEVNGKRELWHGVALDTNLCYSNQKVRDTMTDAIVAYCKENPAIDYLHFWLADGSNNHCECENCKKLIPSDHYVRMLNELDQKMTAAGVKTKVVFLIYVDLLWAPEVYKIENPDRFVLMFAPITRTYSKALTDYDHSEKPTLLPYVRNQNKMPKSVAENIARLESWQASFPGDSFDFDYHLMWHHVHDLGYYEFARVLHTDMTKLDEIGLNGMVSCQVQRASFPTGLPMYTMARALWDKNARFEDVSREYFAAAFGAEGPAVETYLRSISELIYFTNTRPEYKSTGETAIARFREAIRVVESFRSSHIEKYADTDASWKYLAYHAEIVLRFADLCISRASGDQDALKEKGEALSAYVRGIEPAVHNVLDVWNFVNVMSDKYYRI